MTTLKKYKTFEMSSSILFGQSILIYWLGLLGMMIHLQQSASELAAFQDWEKLHSNISLEVKVSG